MINGRWGAEPSSDAVEAIERDSLEFHELRLTAVTAHGWRITDRRLPIFDPCRVVAFIERRGDSFEVMHLGGGIEWHEFASLHEAVQFVIVSAPRIAQERMGSGAARAPSVSESA
jgi:hypothetical protein